MTDGYSTVQRKGGEQKCHVYHFFVCVLVHVFTSPGANVEIRKELLELALSIMWALGTKLE